jgi:hypothetical protein
MLRPLVGQPIGSNRVVLLAACRTRHRSCVTVRHDTRGAALPTMEWKWGPSPKR